ncbi:MAG: hypothetical protein J0I12_30985 [Candidatus Eremiobacteraeota bacterium]|nr:hypothetical protein [Candidatus Eremiobacteraeota bacterium]
MEFSFQGETQTCLSARLGLSLETESWDGKDWVYGKELQVMVSLEVMVDEDSGEDGAAAPDAHWVMKPIPADLFHSEWDDSAPEFEAWFGNDAPVLENNRIRMTGRNDAGQVQVEWTADCGRLPMKCSGWVDFSGLAMRVRQPEDAPGFLKKVHPAWAKLKPVEEEMLDFGAAMPENRRVWHSLRFELP